MNTAMAINLENYRCNARGDLVHVSKIKEIDQLRDEVVLALVGMAQEHSKLTSDLKHKVMEDFQAFLDLSAEKYEVAHGGDKGNVQITSFDGNFRITREVADRMEFDERIHAAKALINECMTEWTSSASVEVKALIDLAFATDRRGKINTKRILELRRVNIDHPKWKVAMQAIGDSLAFVESCIYYRFYVRDDQGKYVQIPLDFSVV